MPMLTLLMGRAGSGRDAADRLVLAFLIPYAGEGDPPRGPPSESMRDESRKE